MQHVNWEICLSTVQELFGDVGPLKNARLVKPGVADVIFVNVEDALAAVKTYHMRLLDGKIVTLCSCSAICWHKMVAVVLMRKYNFCCS